MRNRDTNSNCDYATPLCYNNDYKNKYVDTESLKSLIYICIIARNLSLMLMKITFI